MSKNFINFTQAMEELKKGNAVRFYEDISDNYAPYVTFTKYDAPIGTGVNSFKEFLEGTWEIVGECEHDFVEVFHINPLKKKLICAKCEETVFVDLKMY